MSASRRESRKGFVLCLVFLLGVLVVLFHRSFDSELVLFANDGPLGALMADQVRTSNPLTGFWTDLSWVGVNSGAAAPGPTTILVELLGSVPYSKYYGPLTLLLVGISAWLCFRQWGFQQWVAIVGALAAALNMNSFSNVCWGLGTRALTLTGAFLALAALGNGHGRFYLVRCALAGLAVGVGVMEGADNGAFYSLFIAAFTVFLTFIQEGSPGVNLAKGVGRVALVAGFAFFIAYQTLIALIGTQITGVAGMAQTQEAKEERWDRATQWSLPKLETLRVIIPGIFGYRMEQESPTPRGGEYWGTVGRQPGWEQHHQGFMRHSGSGEYAGVLVVLVALWACAQAIRRAPNVFTDHERKVVWFWSVAALISLLLAYGRYAPFYRIVYALPYFSTIRNPIKLMHPFHLSLLILFGYGLHGLSRRYLETAAAKSASMIEQLKTWWAKATPFEKRWTMGSLAAIAVSVLGYLGYATSRSSLVQYLTKNGFVEADAGSIARHSANEVGLFVLFLILSVALLTLIMGGVFAGRRARWAAVGLGLLLTMDLARANTPWIKYYDYKEKYGSNPVIDILRTNAHEHRVVMPPFQAGREFKLFQDVYAIEWLQHHFLYYNIQSLDMAQDTRPPAEKIAYRSSLMTNNIARLWQLTNSRYVCGMVGFADSFNQQFDPEKKRFRNHTLFTFVQTASGRITAQLNQTGPFAIIEFTGALPRAKLYSQWQMNTNREAVLQQLSSASFDPEQMVLISDELPASPAVASTNQSPGTVQFVSYAPKHLQLRSEAPNATVLLLNDVFDPDWKVKVDGQSAKILRANYLMRGVYLPGGTHTIEFSFRPSLTPLYVTTSAIAVGVLLCGFLLVAGRREAPASDPKPVAKAKQPVTP